MPRFRRTLASDTQDRRGLKVWLTGKVPNDVTIAGVDAPVPVCERAARFRVVELCSGLSGFSCTALRAGVSVCTGVDQNGLWQKLFESIYPGASFYCGDLTDPAVLRKLLLHELFHGVLCGCTAKLG